MKTLQIPLVAMPIFAVLQFACTNKIKRFDLFRIFVMAYVSLKIWHKLHKCSIDPILRNSHHYVI